MKKIILTILISTTFLVFGQDQTKTKSLSDKTKKELMSIAKELFEPPIAINYSISTNDLMSSYEDMQTENKIDENSLNQLLETEKPTTFDLNNIAIYYAGNNQHDLANKYYLKALKNINLKEFKKDSAFYYSFRGALKVNLYDETASNDFDRSLKINPSDSIATIFYPFILIAQGKHKKLTKMMEKQLNTSKDNLYVPYLFLSLSTIVKSSIKNQQIIFDDVKLKKSYSTKNYNEIIDFKLIDKYLKQNKGNVLVQNCSLMTHITGLLSKLMFFETDSNFKIIKNYTNFEKNKLKEIILNLKTLGKEKKLNKYTLNKSLGFCYYLLEKNDKAIAYFKKAIKIFPKNKKGSSFTDIECYDALIAIYEKSDKINYRKTINSKIKKGTKENSIPDLTLLALDYFHAGEFIKTEEYCQKIRNNDIDNFEALSLLFHVSFLQQSTDLADFYGEIARSKIKSIDEQCTITIQYLIYNLYQGRFQNSIEILGNIKKEKTFYNYTPLCDKLIKIIEAHK